MVYATQKVNCYPKEFWEHVRKDQEKRFGFSVIDDWLSFDEWSNLERMNHKINSDDYVKTAPFYYNSKCNSKCKDNYSVIISFVFNDGDKGYGMCYMAVNEK